jgi:hypothetical protein
MKKNILFFSILVVGSCLLARAPHGGYKATVKEATYVRMAPMPFDFYLGKSIWKDIAKCSSRTGRYTAEYIAVREQRCQEGLAYLEKLIESLEKRYEDKEQFEADLDEQINKKKNIKYKPSPYYSNIHDIPDLIDELKEIHRIYSRN